MLLEEVEVVENQVVVEAIVAEAQHALHRAGLAVLNHPFQVLGLQVGDAHMAHHTLAAKFHQGGQRLLNHLVEVGELHVVHVDDVDVVHVQALHALIHALRGTPGRVVPGVHAVLPITSHLRGEVVLVAGNVLEGLAQHCLCLEMAVIGRHVNEVDAIVDGHIDSTDALVFTYAVKHTPKG